MKKLVSMVIVFLLAVLNFTSAFAASPSASAGQTNSKIYLNGERIYLERKTVLKNQRILVAARTTFQRMGIKIVWNPGNQGIRMTKGSTVVEMRIGDKNAVVNNTMSSMEAEPFLADGVIMVPLRFIAESFDAKVMWDSQNDSAFIKTSQDSAGTSKNYANKRYVVVIDPGHGGSDAGAVYNGVREKDLNLDISRRLNELLRAKGIKTYMTRTDDSFVGLYERSALADRVNADLLISIHNNADDSAASGSMSLYHPYTPQQKGSLDSRTFAAIVQKEMTGSLQTSDMGITPRPNLAVLRTSNVPTVLAEVGFMTNSRELARLKTPEFRQRSAEALERAIIKSLEKVR